MNVTFTCRHYEPEFRPEKIPKAPTYGAFGRVVQAGKRACLGSLGLVRRSVAVECPVLVDLCARDCLVEMGSSCRYVVVGEKWRKREYLSIVKQLYEQQIYVMTEVEPIDIEAAKQRLRATYYQSDGKTLLNSKFVDDMSPDNMAEEGLHYYRRDEVCCEYYHFGSCFPEPAPWNWQGHPQNYHRQVHGRLPCILLKKYHYPILTSQADENITHATFRMVMPGGVAGHPPVGCNRAILVVPKSYELPTLDRREWQQVVRSAQARQASLLVRNQISFGYVNGPDFSAKVRQAIKGEHFDQQLSLASQQIEQFLNGVKQFARQLTDEADKTAIATDIDALIKALDITVIEAEVDTVIARITDFEQTSAGIKRLGFLPEPVRDSGAAAMLTVVEKGFGALAERYSSHYFDNAFFAQIVKTGDISELFCRYQQHIYGNTSKAREEMSVAWAELTSSLAAIHEKIRELLDAYLQACRMPIATGATREALTSPLFKA